MEVKDMSLFPHMLRCWFGGETFTGLITVPGRAPLCLRCNQVGHVRGTCPLSRPIGREEEDLVVDEAPAQARPGPRVMQPPVSPVVPLPLLFRFPQSQSQSPSIVPPVVPMVFIPVVLTAAVPVPIPVAVEGGEEVGTPSPASDLVSPPP